MFGMEKTKAEQEHRRESILFSWKRMAALIVILCLSWSSVRAVFKRNMLEDYGAKAFAQGGIGDQFDSHGNLSFDTSFVAQTLMRDTVVFYSLLPSLDMGVDVIFLPAFNEWDGNGILKIRWPMNARIFTDFNENDNGQLKLKTRAFFGVEYIAEYKNDFYYGFKQFIAARLNRKFSWNSEIAIADVAFSTNGFSSFLGRFQNAFSYQVGIGRYSLAYLLTADYQNPSMRISHTIKIGSRFSFSKKFFLFAGGSYSLSDNGWSLSTGSTFSSIPLFRGTSSITAAMEYRPIVGFSFALSLNWKKTKIKALRQDEPSKLFAN